MSVWGLPLNCAWITRAKFRGMEAFAGGSNAISVSAVPTICDPLTNTARRGYTPEQSELQ